MTEAMGLRYRFQAGSTDGCADMARILTGAQGHAKLEYAIRLKRACASGVNSMNTIETA